MPGSDEDIRQMMETFPDLKTNCNNKFWVPVRQRNGRSALVDNNNPVNECGRK